MMEESQSGRKFKRRVQRACDTCRRKKRDGLRTSAKKCSHCIENKSECLFSGAPSERRSYLDVLETRLKNTEILLRKMAAESSASTTDSPGPGNSHLRPDSPPREPLHERNRGAASASVSATGPGVELAALTIRSMNVPAPTSHGDDLAYIELVADMQELEVKQHSDRFIGKSSAAMLVKAAAMARQFYEDKMIPWTSRRMHYWTYNAGEHKTPHSGPFVFPDPDLLASLVDLYFTHTNIYFPLLHRPTFQRHIGNGLHERDRLFGALVLLVCGVGARFSADPRVCPPDTQPLRVGWQFFDQLSLSIADHLFSRPTLHQIQFYCLAHIFLEFTTPAARWMVIGIGIRLAQDAGAHRLQPQGELHTAERELWKRAWWVLICMERVVSSGLGRPCTTRFEDFDTELPLEVDDEYWPSEVDADMDRESETGHLWAQPESKPSTIAYFNCMIRLNQIMGFNLHLLYALNKRKSLLAHRDTTWEVRIVTELDAALDKWEDDIPAHLRWNPTRRRSPEDDLFFNQSALMYCTYYGTRISLHRSFIQSIMTGKNPTFPVASLSTCTNAARSTSHIIETAHIRANGAPVPVLMPYAFIAGLTLALSVWDGKRTGLPPHMNTAIHEVQKCMESLQACEERWQSAGLFRDLLHELTIMEPTPGPCAPAIHSPSDSVRAAGEESIPSPAETAERTDELKGSRALKRGRKSRHPVFISPDVGQTIADVRNLAGNSSPPGQVPAAMPPAPTAQIVYTPRAVDYDEPMYLEDMGSTLLDIDPQLRLQFGSDSPQTQAPGSNTGSTSSTWYPSQESSAPLGFPDFTTAGYTGSRSTGESGGMPDGETRVDLGAGPSVGAPTQPEVDAWGSYFDIMSELGQGLLDPSTLAGV